MELLKIITFIVAIAIIGYGLVRYVEICDSGRRR